MHLVEDEDLALQVGWRVRNKGDQVLAHVVDAVGGGGVGFDHVEGGAFCNGDARAAGAAGFALGGGEAVERFGDDAGGRGLAGAAWANKEEAVAESAVGDGAAQGLGDGVLATELTEGGGTVAAIDSQLLRHAPLPSYRSPHGTASAAGRAIRCARRDPLSAASFRI